jgi:hypothetical protein
MAIKGSEAPDGSIVPHLVVPDASQAAKFYETAFEAVALYRSPPPTGAGEHIHLRIFNLSPEEVQTRMRKVYSE